MTSLPSILRFPIDLKSLRYVLLLPAASTVTSKMSGYSTREKVRIACNHVVPSQFEVHGVCRDYVKIPEDSIALIAEEYTREAGVRQLSRHLSSLARHAALSIANALNCQDEDCTAVFTLPILFDRTKIEAVLGSPLYGKGSRDLIDRLRVNFRPGMVFGLAWTPHGGQLMLIEGVVSQSHKEGKGRITMTGKLGDVLKESIDVAVSWINANCRRLDIDSLEGKDIHIHLPSGAIGKDGPSAGCALVSSLFSLSTNLLLRSDTVVTGEISLTGNVLPVGGIKEKVLGAHREGIRRIVLPEANKSDVMKIDDEILCELEVEYVRDIDELINLMSTKTLFISSKL